jgi:hypothetical protein
VAVNESTPHPPKKLPVDLTFQALVHLLRTDDQFVGKLHQAYVETLSMKLH